MRALELWGGHECTVNRVGSTYYDQTRLSGHHDRPGDLDSFAALGLRRLRYPVLWERTAPEHPDACDWRWADERLGRIRDLGMEPIVGLVHHGAGPRYTSLMDDGFARGLARYAGKAAERYPWVTDWTPVNEPLTTARFSALYGHWHPHLTDESFFWAALVNQIDATRLSMREIRRVNPQARLIQTEDLGRTYATAEMAHQAEFDNARRWMTWDLLCGRVVQGHPLWERLTRFGLGERLKILADDPCPPDVIGVNHYLTSDRFLDHRLDDYPAHRWGGNAFMRFADVEAVRAVLPGPGLLQGALEEAWERYGRTLAVTECHLSCTREDQARWLGEAWDTAKRLRERGVEVEAVTAWSLLGAFDWNSLLTRRLGHYEPGAFDVRGPAPRPTALAGFIKTLTTPEAEPHPAALGAGWWRRDLRLTFRPVFRTVASPEPRPEWRAAGQATAPLLIVGATGTLGKALARACEWRGLDYVLTDRTRLSLDDADSMARALDAHRPWGVVNAAGWVRVDDAEGEADACRAANALGPAALAAICRDRGLPFLGFSSDLVFDGRLGRAYVEDDPTRPLNAYGRSKAEAEAAVLGLGGQALMIRTAAFFSPYDPHNFARAVTRALTGGETFDAASDLIVSPTYVPDLVENALDLMIDGETGLWHLANPGAVTWAEFATMIAEAVGLDAGLIRPVRSAQFGWAAPRPGHAPLASSRGQLMPPLENAVARYAAVVQSSDFAGMAEAEARVDRSSLAHPRPAAIVS